jgi:hypothetical protein
MTEEIKKPKIAFSDFLGMVEADDRRFQDEVVRKVEPRLKVPPIAETHIFRMGDDEDIMQSIMPIRKDIAEDCRERIPMPFSDLACASTVPMTSSGGERHWVLDRLIESPSFRKEDPPGADLVEERGWKIHQHLFIMRYTEHNRLVFGPTAIPSMWHVWFCGTHDIGYRSLNAIDELFNRFATALLGDRVGLFYDLVMKETASVLEQLAAISHPQNYVVRVTPELTPKENHRIASGHPRPARKSPHYIVVDHEVLVSMSNGHYGTHASPVPHERRGHWRRLAERCVHARLQKDRVFVRPTYVGEKTFTDPKNRYEVLLDFGKKEAS